MWEPDSASPGTQMDQGPLIPPSSPPPSPMAATLESGAMPKTLFSARWLKWSSVLWT